MALYIVRHGNTFAPGEPPRRIGARTDLPLVASGRAQALALGAHFRANGIRFARILASPLLRTRETAALIAPDAAAEPADWLREIDHGPDEGATEEAMLARIGPDALEAWETQAIPPPGWSVEAPMRIAAWSALLANEPAGAILAVTSNGAARFARIALGLPPARLRTGAYARMIWTDGRAQIAEWDIRPE